MNSSIPSGLVWNENEWSLKAQRMDLRFVENQRSFGDPRTHELDEPLAPSNRRSAAWSAARTGSRGRFRFPSASTFRMEEAGWHHFWLIELFLVLVIRYNQISSTISHEWSFSRWTCCFDLFSHTWGPPQECRNKHNFFLHNAFQGLPMIQMLWARAKFFQPWGV